MTFLGFRPEVVVHVQVRDTQKPDNINIINIQGFKTYFSLLNVGPYLQSLLGLNEVMTNR